MPSSSWHIAFGDYDLSVDRRALTLSLTETKTGTVWGTGVALGWIELQERTTGDIARHDFGSLRQVSVSEKAGPQGKRILWGLDADGIPVDVYLICSQREIQMVVEASRDSKTHRVQGFGLVPGLCSVPEGDGNFRILPLVGGTYLRPRAAPEKMPLTGQGEPHWQVWDDLAMPLTGAVRCAADIGTSALGLFTDSAYAHLADTGTAYNWEYERDPERRRLDLRVLVFPDGDAISVARAYREKQIASNNHVTLRRKMRENPALEQVIGCVLLLPRGKNTGAEGLATRLEDGYGVRCVIRQRSNAPEISSLPIASLHDVPELGQTRWDDLEDRLQVAKRLQEAGTLADAGSPVDWAAIAADFWTVETGDAHEIPLFPNAKPVVPLQAVVYHDSVIPKFAFYTRFPPSFALRAMLNLAVPTIYVDKNPVPVEQFGAVCAVLCPLHQFTFAAFLTEHRFLTNDYLVEEAVYSDKTRIVINQSKTDTFESDELTLPPLGFYVRHRQMEAHDALRVGAERFVSRKYRITRADDGKPLESSENIIRQEFVAPFHGGETETGENPLS